MKTGDTLLHSAAKSGLNSFIKVLLRFKARLDILNDNGYTALVCAIRRQEIHCIQTLRIASMGGETREVVDNLAFSIEKTSNIMDHLLNILHIKPNASESDKKENELSYKCCDLIVTSMIELIKSKLPFSDHLLLFCWKYINIVNSNNNNKTAIDSKFWKQIESTCNEILNVNNPSKQRDFVFFKEYLFTSLIWHQNQVLEITDDSKDKSEELYPISIKFMSKDTSNASDNNDNQNKTESKESNEIPLKTGNKSNQNKVKNMIDMQQELLSKPVLFDKLHSIAMKNLQPQKAFLKESIETLMESKESQEDWNKILNFKDYLICKENETLRQDRLYAANDESKTCNIMKNGVKSSFSETEMNRLSIHVANELDSHHFYESHGYLSKLLIVAYTLNYKFQKDICTMMARRGISDDSYYQQAPVKSLDRAQIKSETDYQHEPFPSSACIADCIRCVSLYLYILCFCFFDLVWKYCFDVLYLYIYAKNRCSFTYDNCKLFLSEINKFIDKVKTNEENIKQSKKDAELYCITKILRIKNTFRDLVDSNGNIQKFDYADIKINVLVEYGGKSIIGEVCECAFPFASLFLISYI